MNTVEKTKVEKIIVGDIKTSEASYKTTRQHNYNDLRDKLEEKPPKAIKALSKAFLKATKDLANVVAQAKKEGWNLSSRYNTPDTVEAKVISVHNSYASDAKEEKQLASHSQETKDTLKELTDLQRAYTIKIFAPGAEMEELFKEFGEALNEITSN